MPACIQSSQPTAAAAVLDEASLQRLRELDPAGTQQVVERVLRAYEASLRRLLPQARQAFAQGDHGAVRHVVHTLKSSSASVGALELSRRCGDIEAWVRLHRGPDIDALLAGLEHEGAAVLRAVQAMLAE